MTEALYDQKINGPIIGIVLRDLVQRAIRIARKHRSEFEVHTKGAYGSFADDDDFFTNADTECQAMYVKLLQECFPSIGIIGEEGGLSIDTKVPGTYFTLDPIDGTKAFIRRQSHGIGTMVALVHNHEVISAYIGDMNTGEVFGYRPQSQNVHRLIVESGHHEILRRPQEFSNLLKGYIQLRDPLERSNYTLLEWTVDKFAGQTVDGGSIGTWLARLWKQEVTAALLSPGHETPWDSTPIIGICQKLGYVFLRPDVDTVFLNFWKEYPPELPTTVVKREHPTLIIHRSHLSAVQDVLIQND
jgi:fructose-1,6-bisphosphatase/inositol monophosphatase family enzyme